MQYMLDLVSGMGYMGLQVVLVLCLSMLSAGAVLAAASKCNTPNVKIQPPSRAGPPPNNALRKRQPVPQKKTKDHREQEEMKADKPPSASAGAVEASSGSASAVAKNTEGTPGKVCPHTHTGRKMPA